jgi:proteasome lid subunit RPN8/RPN11
MSGMFKRKHIEGLQVKISICKDVLETIFDECDRNNENETGGRIIGYFDQHANKLNIKACGVIDPGPNARRSPTGFFQDGENQEAVFRKIEANYPEIEHLGNWHTHHVNGLNTLSSGDIGTYKRIVNHDKHNTDLFYALLVVAKNHASYRERYLVKHFLFKRGEPLVHVLLSSEVKSTKEPAVFLGKIRAIEEIPEKETILAPLTSSQSSGNYIRARDKEVISEMYPVVKAFFSKQANSLYWKGKLHLIDDTSVDIIVLESINGSKLSYSIALSGLSAGPFECNRSYLKLSFDSAWKAIYSLERDLNREIFTKLKRLSVDYGR